MAISKVFKSTIPSCTFVCTDGMVLPFINGRLETDNPKYARELTNEVGTSGFGKSKHPHIYVDDKEQEVDSEALTPLELIKKQALEEALAIVRSERNSIPSPNESKSKAGNFAASVANTNNIAGPANSDSGSEAVANPAVTMTVKQLVAARAASTSTSPT